MSDLGSVLFRTIPEVAQTGLANGELGVFGSVIRSTKTGQIAYHLQETGAFGQFASMLMPGGVQLEAAKAISQVAGDAALYRQGQQIKAAVDLLSQQQWANLLVSGATLGVSVAGFAVLAHRISGIERQISSLDQRLVDIKRSIDALRDERISDDLSLLRTVAQQMDESWSLREPTGQLNRVASDSHVLANRFFDRAVALLDSDDGRLAWAAPMFDAFGLAQSTRISARLAAEEEEAARRASDEGLDQYEAILGRVDATADAMATFQSEEAGELKDWPKQFDDMFDASRLITSGLRDRAEALESTRELLVMLRDTGTGGRELISAARRETEAPVLFIAANRGD